MDDSLASEPLAVGRLADAELIRRVQADDLDAFEAFFDRYRGIIHRTAYGLTGDVHAAEEILQDTFIRAYRHRASLRTDISPVPWLHRVALNLCYSRLGRRRLEVEPIGETATELRDAALGPPEQIEREELRRSIRTGVAALPPKHQSVVVLYYLHGMSLQETSAALGIALGTVKSRLHYALHALRGHLAAERPETATLPLPGALAVRPARRGGDR
ncbi:MAG TPA: RNA polymerase sigma factor [Candidatus Limnocylindrales bacterium]|nr:RNA polymerase sigma factor [Candidatus Limnocylindrales bacterium]